jgi:hypothetical protein
LSAGNSNAQVAGPGNEGAGTTKDGSGEDTTNVSADPDASDAMIIKVENDVRLKRKGQSDFVQIPGGMFRSGDLLRVGASSAAFADCSDSVCKLDTGDFSTCCRPACATRIALGPAPTAPTRPTVAINELPNNEQQELRTSETQIRALGADDITTQFLIASLYSAWKVKEAKVEVDKFSEKLNDPEASQKLRTLYWPMVKKNGDLYNRLGNKGQAEQTYKKLTEAPDSEDRQTKAAAHVALGQIQIENGKKAEAIQNLQKGQQLYEVEGNHTKAENVRTSINKIQRQ